MSEIFVLIIIFVAAELLIGYFCERYKKTSKENHVKNLLREGFSVEKDRVYLYSYCSGYKVLDLNKPYKQEDTYWFDKEDFEEALKKFLELTNAN